MTGLTAEQATGYARVALDNIRREYPNATQHVLAGPDDETRPRALHPAFYGSFDWHSCVHMHWLLVRLLRLRPDLPVAAEARATLDAHLTDANLAAEAAYLAEHPMFERPYGWGWALRLAEEAAAGGEPAGRWAAALAPLAGEVERRFLDWLPRAAYPIRAGTHANSAFGLVLALSYAKTGGRDELAGAVREAALRWFGADAGYPAGWEPSGEDFLSPALVEAVLLRDVLPPDRFGGWLAGFLPGLAAGEPASLTHPVTVTDRADGRIVHLDGLNLSRAWCWRQLAAALGPADPRTALAAAAADRHLAAALPHVASGRYGGDHWLASFATLALTD